MKAVIVGANGYIGYNLTEYLVKQGVEVVAFVPQGFDYAHVKQLLVQCEEFTLDTLHEVELDACKNADVLFNMVWVGFNQADRDNAEIQASNLLHNVRVVEFTKNHGIPKLIVPGSAAQYACGQGVIDGKGLPAPPNLYAAAKTAAYDYCKVLCEKSGLQLVWTLITSIYGPGRNDNNLITYAIKTLLKGERPSFTGLEQQWDYLYIDDLMKALYLLASNELQHAIYPIGSGEHRQMREYVEIIRDSINPTLPLGIGDKPYMSAVIDNQIMDIRALVEDTGFKADYTFEEGISIVIDDFRSRVAK